MNLKMLTFEDITRIKGSAVYLVKYNPAYIKEIYSKYPDFPEICGVLDENERKQGTFEVAGREIVVHPMAFEAQLPSSATIIITDGYFQEYYDILLKNEYVKNNFDIIYYYANKDTAYYISYKERFKDTPLQNMIIFRSGPPVSAYVRGTDFYDNARALFEYMLSAKLNEKYELVWFVKEPEEFRHIEENNKNVRFLPIGGATSDDPDVRDEYYRCLCLAKYIFMTDAYGFCRYPREGQTRIQLWHGCGFKTRTTFARCEHRYEYNIVISPLYKKIHEKIYGLRDDQVIITGYPKEDLLYHPAKDWREKLHIKEVKKYIFWLPTFRTPVSQLSDLVEMAPEGETGLPMVSDFKSLERINDLLKANNMVMIIKLHPVQDPTVISRKVKFSNIDIIDNVVIYDNDLQINELLGYASALISDYSSAAVDYLRLDRPIAFTLDDVEEYEKSRGFVFDPIRDWLPGVELRTPDDMYAFVEEIAKGIDSSAEKRRRIASKMHAFRDDQNSRRVVEALGIV